MNLVSSVAGDTVAGEPATGSPAAARSQSSQLESSLDHGTDIATELLRNHESSHTIWRIQCGDVIGRGRCVTVHAAPDGVVVSCPPGETARMTSEQINQLRLALDEASALAEGSR